MATERPQAIFLPGGVLPAEQAYGSLLEALGGDVEAVAMELEVYAGVEPPQPPPGPPPPWMAKRPAGLRAFIVAFTSGELHLDALRRFRQAWAGNEGLDPAEAVPVAVVWRRRRSCEIVSNRV